MYMYMYTAGTFTTKTMIISSLDKIILAINVVISFVIFCCFFFCFCKMKYFDNENVYVHVVHIMYMHVYYVLSRVD